MNDFKNIVFDLHSNPNALAAEIHLNAVAHGWWDKERSLAEIIALIHSELSEALEEYRAERPMLWYQEELSELCANNEGRVLHTQLKPEGVAVELADAVIRILDYCGRQEINIETALQAQPAIFDSYTLPALITECHALLSAAYKRAGLRSTILAECISVIKFWCKENGGDLGEVIKIKHEYNKTRPYRHGGKKC